MSKPTYAQLKRMHDYEKDRADRAMDMLTVVRRKAKMDGDIEYSLHGVLKAYQKLLREPYVDTPEWQQIHGVPFDD
jgi:hypothetical protein